MKNILILSVAIFALSSCSKDYNCDCKGESYLENTQSEYTYAVHGTKKDAQKKCEESRTDNTLAKYDCKLK